MEEPVLPAGPSHWQLLVDEHDRNFHVSAGRVLLHVLSVGLLYVCVLRMPGIFLKLSVTGSSSCVGLPLVCGERLFSLLSGNRRSPDEIARYVIQYMKVRASAVGVAPIGRPL